MRFNKLLRFHSFTHSAIFFIQTNSKRKNRLTSKPSKTNWHYCFFCLTVSGTKAPTIAIKNINLYNVWWHGRIHMVSNSQRGLLRQDVRPTLARLTSGLHAMNFLPSMIAAYVDSCQWSSNCDAVGGGRLRTKLHT